MIDQLNQLFEQAKKEIEKVDNHKFLEELRVKYLGKKGPIKDILSQVGKLDPEQRKEVGQVANKIKSEIADSIESTQARLDDIVRQEKLKSGVADISVPLSVPTWGTYHPITLVRNRMIRIFSSMGFTVEEGPELEDEFYNFDALNIPPFHPARDDHDSFYVGKNKVMRTHTSPVQIRVMKNRQPPIAVVVPGRCFRRDAVDATHSHTFHQMEGLVVDKNITFADLRGTLLLWAKMMFGEHTRIRMRPDFFPFTEPSAELAVTCHVCKGEGCSVCKHTGWIEIAGCGMVDPEVFKNVGYDPEKISGFAFGFGLERIAMSIFGIGDIRQFFDNDMRLLDQFIK